MKRADLGAVSIINLSILHHLLLPPLPETMLGVDSFAPSFSVILSLSILTSSSYPSRWRLYTLQLTETDRSPIRCPCWPWRPHRRTRSLHRIELNSSKSVGGRCANWYTGLASADVASVVDAAHWHDRQSRDSSDGRALRT